MPEAAELNFREFLGGSHHCPDGSAILGDNSVENLTNSSVVQVKRDLQRPPLPYRDDAAASARRHKFSGHLADQLHICQMGVQFRDCKVLDDLVEQVRRVFASFGNVDIY